MFAFGVFEHAARIDLSFPSASFVDHSLLQLVVAVSSKHVTLPKDSNATLHIIHEFRSESLRGDCEKFALRAHIRTARFRFLHDLGLEEVERLRERSGRP